MPIDDCRMETDDCDIVAARNRDKQRVKSCTDKDSHKMVMKSKIEMREIEKEKHSCQREETKEDQNKNNCEEEQSRIEGERDKEPQWNHVVGVNADVSPNHSHSHRERTSPNNRFHALTAIGVHYIISMSVTSLADCLPNQHIN